VGRTSWCNVAVVLNSMLILVFINRLVIFLGSSGSRMWGYRLDHCGLG